MKSLLIFLGVLFCGFLVFNQSKEEGSVDAESKIRGMHIFGRTHQSDEGLDRLAANNVEWVTHVPYIYQKTPSTVEIRHSKKDSLGRWTRRDSSWIRISEMASSKDLRSIMKPHIWMSNAGADEWRNAINFSTEDDWKTWESNYRNSMLHYAELAELTGMELFCIGVEMKSTVRSREAFWRALIKDVRQIYSGKITYGANWYEEYQEVPFWDALDYIGVQAYFPVAKKDNPSVAHIKDGWQPYIKDLKQLSDRYQRPILFTEIGYKSTADGATTPWEWPEMKDDSDIDVSEETQNHAYIAFFEALWDQEWFAGALFWQWRTSSKYENRSPISFSPEGRPAEQSMAKGFGK